MVPMWYLLSALCAVVGEILVAPPQQQQPQPNADVVTVIHQVNQKVDRLNSTITGRMQSMETKVDNLITDMKTINKKLDAPKRSWLLQQTNLCFGAKDHSYGKFTLKNEGRIIAAKLVYKSGYVSCNIHAGYKSHWGCSEKQAALLVYITDEFNRITLPKTISSKAGIGYTLIGYHTDSKELVLTDYATAIYGTVGTEFRIWYSEDLYDATTSDNGGTTCADVYVMVE